MVKSWVSMWILGAAVATGCDSSGGMKPPMGGGPEAVLTLPASGQPFDVRATPWPSDALRGSDGRLKVQGPLPMNGNVVAKMAAALSERDGFATTGALFFPVSADVAVDTGAFAVVVDLEDTSKRLQYPLVYRAATKQLAALPPLGTALAEHHAYAAWIEAGVHDASARPLAPSSEMARALGGDGAVGAQPTYQKLAALLKAEGRHPLAATAFTTQTLTDWVAPVLADLASAPKLTVSNAFTDAAALDALFGGAVTDAGNTLPGQPPTGGVHHENVVAVVEGTYDSPFYLADSDGHLGIIPSPPQKRATIPVPFLLALPKRAGGDYKNVPLVIFQHGLGSDRSAVLVIANSYASRGYAVLGIDTLFHGSRQPNSVDKVNNISGAMGGDGIGDPQGDDPTYHFFDVTGDGATGVLPIDVRAIRDNFRQAAIDFMQEVRLAANGDWSVLKPFLPPDLAGLTLDGSHLVYSGESFGSILGAAVLAVDPLLHAAVFDVGGGGLAMNLVAYSPSFASMFEFLVSSAYDDQISFSDVDGKGQALPSGAQMSVTLLQQLVDPGDGLALSVAADPSKQVLFLEAYGDEVVGNRANEALDVAWGATQVTVSQRSHAPAWAKLPTAPAPYQAANLRAAVIFDPATHVMFTSQVARQHYMPPFPPFTMRPAPVTVNNPIAFAHQLALGFFDNIRAGAAKVVDVTPTP